MVSLSSLHNPTLNLLIRVYHQCNNECCVELNIITIILSMKPLLVFYMYCDVELWFWSEGAQCLVVHVAMTLTRAS